MKRSLFVVLLCLFCSRAYTEDGKVPPRTFEEFVIEASGGKLPEDRKAEPRAFYSPLFPEGSRGKALVERVVVKVADVISGDDRVYVLFQPKEPFDGPLRIRFRPLVNDRPLSLVAESVTLREMTPHLVELPFERLHLAQEIRRFEESIKENTKDGGLLEGLAEETSQPLRLSIDIIEFGSTLKP